SQWRQLPDRKRSIQECPSCPHCEGIQRPHADLLSKPRAALLRQGYGTQGAGRHSVREWAFSFCAIAFLGRKRRALDRFVVANVLLRPIVHFRGWFVAAAAGLARDRRQLVAILEIR